MGAELSFPGDHAMLDLHGGGLEATRLATKIPPWCDRHGIKHTYSDGSPQGLTSALRPAHRLANHRLG
jgi:hypothetical protein